MTLDERVSCGHGADGDPMDSCFGCIHGESIGPHLPPKPPRKIRYSATFVQQFRSLSGDHRWPLKIEGSDHE